jgi:hypothetical protein
LIYTLDADIGGTEVVQHLIDAGLVKRYPCQMFKDFDRAVLDIIPQAQPGDTVIIDTISSLANQTRGDHKLGTDVMDEIWAKSHLFFGDKQGMLAYEATQQQIMRRVRNLMSYGEKFIAAGKDPLRLIVLAHQREQVDPVTQMKGSFGPDLNQAFFSALYGTASDMFRLDVQIGDLMNDETGQVKVPDGTRVLYIKRTDEHITKNRCAMDVSTRLPKGILNPTLPKLYEVLHRKPRCLVIYSPGGAGKTTLAHSVAQAEYEASQTKATPLKKKEAPANG